MSSGTARAIERTPVLKNKRSTTVHPDQELISKDCNSSLLKFSKLGKASPPWPPVGEGVGPYRGKGTVGRV